MRVAPLERVQPTGLQRGLHPDGRERDIGRMYRDTTGTVGGASPWWSITNVGGRAEPHQGRCDTLEEAKAAWRRCWDSAETPIHWPPSMQRDSSNAGGGLDLS